MKSAIFNGKVIHTRYSPKLFSFAYKISMYFIHISEIDMLASKFAIISVNKFNLLTFNRKSYIGSSNISIEEAIQQKLAEKGYSYTCKNIYMLTHLSYLGYCYNPVTFYYCFDSSSENLEYILAEINNTPWDERHTYVLDCGPNKDKYEFDFAKEFHISPFAPMDLHYKWFFTNPSLLINIAMRTFKNQKLYFDAILNLKRIELTNKSIIKEFFKFPLMTQEVIFKIYWQAFKLWCNKFPFYSHPRKNHE